MPTQQMSPEELAAEEERVAAVRQSREARRQAHLEKMDIRRLERIKQFGRV